MASSRKARRRTRRGWTASRPVYPPAGPAPAPPEFRWAVRMLEALAELGPDEQVAAIRQVGAGTGRDALAELGERLGIGPPPLS